ncbi:MAG TPA: methyltransferase domain-containing protein [Terriglobia bacterium]|nr:methyltransferase domain-containing protein [Terriglobia bacterium]
MSQPFHTATRKAWSRAALALVSAAALVGLLRLQAGQDDKARFAERDAWQRPEEVMDKLGLKAGSVVADVGCGSGYFTFHFAARVGAQGRVYAEDIQPSVLEKIQARANQDHLRQIQPIQGTEDDPFLPAGQLDAILVMNAYHEMKHYDAMLRGMYKALKPDGLLAIIDHRAEPGQPRSEYQEGHRIPEPLVREDLARNGFLFLRREPGFLSADTHKHFFFLIFQKPKSEAAPH